MASALYKKVYDKYRERLVRELPGYLDICAAIEDNAEAGELTYRIDDEGNWPFDLNSLNRLKNHDGFQIILNGAGANKMSLSLIGVTEVKIYWNSYNGM